MFYDTGKLACTFRAIEKQPHCFEIGFKLSILKLNPK